MSDASINVLWQIKPGMYGFIYTDRGIMLGKGAITPFVLPPPS